VQEAWHLVQNWLTKRWIDVMNLFGDLTDEQAAAAKQMADHDFADTAGGIEKRRSGAGDGAVWAELLTIDGLARLSAYARMTRTVSPAPERSGLVTNQSG
jgi:hypothetical protein